MRVNFNRLLFGVLVSLLVHHVQVNETGSLSRESSRPDIQSSQKILPFEELESNYREHRLASHSSSKYETKNAIKSPGLLANDDDDDIDRVEQNSDSKSVNNENDQDEQARGLNAKGRPYREGSSRFKADRLNVNEASSRLAVPDEAPKVRSKLDEQAESDDSDTNNNNNNENDNEVDVDDAEDHVEVVAERSDNDNHNEVASDDAGSPNADQLTELEDNLQVNDEVQLRAPGKLQLISACK